MALYCAVARMGRPTRMLAGPGHASQSKFADFFWHLQILAQQRDQDVGKNAVLRAFMPTQHGAPGAAAAES